MTTLTLPVAAAPAQAPATAPRSVHCAAAEILSAHPGIEEIDLYSEDGAAFYDATVGLLSADLGDFVAAARRYRPTPRVLDLAAGSGRLTLPLARRGCHVTALDLSAAMLDRLEQAMAQEHPDTRSRVRPVLHDMTVLDPGTFDPADPAHADLVAGGRYDLATIAATSIVLVPAALRRRLFSGVAAQLQPDGELVLDFLVHDLDSLAASPRRSFVVPVRRDEGNGYAVCVQDFDLPARQEQVCFAWTEWSPGGDVQHRMVTSTKQVFTPAELLADIEAAGLAVVHDQAHELAAGYVTRLLRCRRQNGAR